MAYTREAALAMDESAIEMLRELAAQGGTRAQEILDLLPAEPEPVTETEVHIRWRPVSKRGNGFYAVKYSSAENGSRTLCGAEPTDRDMGWGETRHAKNVACVTCETCKQYRAEGRES